MSDISLNIALPEQTRQELADILEPESIPLSRQTEFEIKDLSNEPAYDN